LLPELGSPLSERVGRFPAVADVLSEEAVTQTGYVLDLRAEAVSQSPSLQLVPCSGPIKIKVLLIFELQGRAMCVCNLGVGHDQNL
jgi:hypothetical protein